MSSNELKSNIEERMGLLLHGCELSEALPWLSDRIHALTLEAIDRAKAEVAVLRRELGQDIPQPFQDAFEEPA